MNTAKELFLSLREKARKAELAKQQLEELKTMAAKCTPVMHLAPSGGGESRTMEDNVLRIEAAEKELQAIIADYVATKLQVMELIRCLDAEEQQVLQLFYVDRLIWMQISQKMNYSESSLRNIRKTALAHADEILKRKQEIADV